VRRGAVTQQPIGELKNGLRADRLSACGFCANAWRLLLHVVAYALVVLFREANAEVPAVACASVGTLRQRLWKVPAVVAAGARRGVLRLSAARPWRGGVGPGVGGGPGLLGPPAGGGGRPAPAPRPAPRKPPGGGGGAGGAGREAGVVAPRAERPARSLAPAVRADRADKGFAEQCKD